MKNSTFWNQLGIAICTWLLVINCTVVFGQNLPAFIRVPPHEEELGPTRWILKDEHSYEADFPGYGTSKQYQSIRGRITVYQYGLGIANWKEMISDSRLMSEMNEVVKEIREMEQKGKYKNVQIGPIENVHFAGYSYLYFEGTLEEPGGLAWTATLLTVKSGQLVKYRMSEHLPTASPSRKAFFAFVTEATPQK